MVNYVSSKKLKDAVVYDYYIVMALVYISSIYSPFIRTGITMSLVLIFLWCKCRLFYFKKANFFILFFGYSFFSFQGYIYNGIPISAFVGDFTAIILPCIFFFIAFDKTFNKEKFYDMYLYSMTLALLIGLYYYIYNPPQFVNHMVNTSLSTYEGDIGTDRIRFQSIYTSTITGTLCVFATIISMFKFWALKEDRLLKKLFYFFVLSLSFVCTMLTSQRSAIVCELAVVISIFPLSFIFRKKIDKYFVILLAIVLTVSVISVGSYIDQLLIVVERLDSLDSSAIDGRSGQWLDTFAHSANLILGTGLGSAGHHAIEYTQYFISDGGIFKYIAEFGIVGSLLFFIPLIFLLLKRLKFLNVYAREYMIIITCLLQSIGSNTICFQQIMPMFWLSVGLLLIPVHKFRSI